MLGFKSYLPDPPTKKGRIINVTHQVPCEITLRNNVLQDQPMWELTPRRGHGAMYGGVQSLETDWETIYIGWTGQMYRPSSPEFSSNTTVTNIQTTPIISLDEKEKQSLIYELQNLNCIPLFLDSDSVFGHYDGYCKTMLWPLFHYIIWDNATDGRLERQQWESFSSVNQLYADAVIENYQEGDVVWVHDYHLLLVPAMVRAKLPRARIGLFVHSPFPSSEIFRCLPKRQQVLKGMLGANLVGFQTYAYARHFISTCTRVLGYESTPEGVDRGDGHFCHVGTFPIGIDTESVDAKFRDPDVIMKVKAITDMYPGKKILVGRDKLDLVKGVLQKLAAFEKFLADYPEWRNKVVLIQLTDGSTHTMEREVTEIIARINGVYGCIEGAAVYHYHHPVQVDEYYALLSAAHAALVTSGRDGMNTTSLEYVMCQQERHGQLILSELMGAAGSMSSALMVNPWDYAGLAKTINDALLMSEEEKLYRHKQLLKHVKSHTASFWARSFVKMLMESVELSEKSSHTPLLRTEWLTQCYRSSTKRLLCFDYEGTLTPLRKMYGLTVPSKSTMDTLEQLCRDPRNEVWIISGRDESTLDYLLGSIVGLGLSAEHGSFMKYPNTKKWINTTEHLDMSWKHDVVEIFTYYSERTAGSFIEHKRSSVTWDYRLADPQYGLFQAKECQNHLEQAILSKMPVDVVVGKKNLEVRPTSVNKGQIVKRLLASNQDLDFVMCCGDDKTDEDMFKAIKKFDVDEQWTFSVKIGTENKKTLALWHLPTTQDLIHSLNAVVTSNV
ncbi:glycosyltransferase family 20-domain-containing protein [Phycomyces blakesleeanus]|uniref:Glycosyltransferase family 20-domain-containing protein n=1 Tax=Phycomyces blakesleeanus TaxID=4837 RepID=A0ABR3BCC9_PHYBL